jgi:hypothetical protein
VPPGTSTCWSTTSAAGLRAREVADRAGVNISRSFSARNASRLVVSTEAFLERFSDRLADDEHAVMVLDQAGWHGAANLRVPNNVHTNAMMAIRRVPPADVPTRWRSHLASVLSG